MKLFKSYKLLIRIFLLLINIFFAKNIFAQDSLLILSSEKIFVDNIGNIYSINNGVITKHFVNHQTKTFSIKTFGTLENIDVTNALRILLYFKDFQRILFLDSQLSQNGDVIELTNLGLEQASLVCSSFNNGFWVYNQANNELLRFNQSLEISVKSGNLKRILGMNIQPNFLIEHNGKLYLNSPNDGILIFDIYGSYLKTIPLKNLESFQVQYPYIFYTLNKKFYSFHLLTFENIEITDISDDCSNIIFNGSFCYLICNNKIKIQKCIK